jgi:hypothetical protein
MAHHFELSGWGMAFSCLSIRRIQWCGQAHIIPFKFNASLAPILNMRLRAGGASNQAFLAYTA